MKIKVNYDLLEKIDESKNGVKLSRALFDRKTIIYLVFAIGTNYSLLSDSKTMKDFVKNVIFITVVWTLGLAGMKYLFKHFKQQYMESAKIELSNLVSQLSSIDVNTSLEKLQEAEVLETNYKFSFVDSKPILTQKKYINIPLTNGYEQCILQEHNIGYSDYEISAQEPEKKVVLKPAKSSI